MLSSYNSDQLKVIAYLNGLTANGAITSNSFAVAYNSSAAKWSNGVIKYWFDPSSNWTTAEKNSMLQSMTLWSGVANVSFEQSSTGSGTALTIADKTRVIGNNDKVTVNGWDIFKDSGTSATNTHATGNIGDTIIPTVQKGLIIIDTKEGGVADENNLTGDTSPLGDENYSHSYNDGPFAVTHELGHVIGLGHSGPYNGSSYNARKDQLNQYDMGQWSIMSYAYANDKGKFYDLYPTASKEANWQMYRETTPMELDIASSQQLYGTPTNKIFSGGQVFGFNSNIFYTDVNGNKAKLGAYDFAINSKPVITIWDSGNNNTINASKFSNDAKIDLRPGSSSSVAGLANNVEIAIGTHVEKAIGGSGNDTFILNDYGDTVDGQGGINITKVIGDSTAYNVTKYENGVVLISDGNVASTLLNISYISFNDKNIDVAALPSSALSDVNKAMSGFNSLSYLAANKDLISSYGTDTTSAFKHWVNYGYNEGRNTTFDATQYLAVNKDVAKALGDDTTAATLHYINYGINEGRLTSGFDAAAYLAANPDVNKAFNGDTTKALQHWIVYGINEGRSTGLQTVQLESSSAYESVDTVGVLTSHQF